MSVIDQVLPHRRALGEALELLGDLPDVRRRADRFHEALADVDDAMDDVDRGLVVCLVGSTGAGKSSLINALAGQQIAVPGVHRPTTTTPVIFAPDDTDPARLEGWRRDPRLGGVDVVSYTAGRGPWDGQVFIDAPDVNSVETVHRERVKALAATADVLLVVLHRQSIVEASPVSFLDDWVDRRRVIFVLNRADEVTPAVRTALVEQIGALAASRWGMPDAPIHAVSAASAGHDPAGSGLQGLVAALGELADADVVQGVRRHRVVGALGRVARLGRDVRDAIGPALAALPSDLSAGLQSAQAAILDEIDRRLLARRVDVATQLSEEVGKRWLGPGGWLIRAGSITALGTGAGALVARRSLVGGAIVAGASALTDRGQRTARQWRLDAGTDMLPTPTDTLAALDAGLVTARARWSRIGVVAPEALSAEAVAEQWLAGLSDTWRAALTRDLPAAANVAVHPVARLVLDLPLVAAVGWVLWQVVDGYVGGSYEGFDFLVNTAILAAAYAVLERTLVLVWLRWRTGQVLAALRQALDRALSDERAKVVRALEAEVAPLGRAVAVLATADELGPSPRS